MSFFEWIDINNRTLINLSHVESVTIRLRPSDEKSGEKNSWLIQLCTKQLIFNKVFEQYDAAIELYEAICQSMKSVT
jgi:hypothetical protein